MGRFSPRPHDLRPYMQGGPAAFSGGLMRGLSTVTGIKDRAERTDILDRRTDIAGEEADARVAELEFRLAQAERTLAHEYDFRREAPVVAEGPSSPVGATPQEPPSGAGAIPKVGGMAGPPGGEEGPSTQSGAQQGPGMDPALPYIQGTEIPGDRFPRVNVPGGSMLERPRSYHQKQGALEGAHEELYGDPMPGVSESLAMGIDPYEPPRTSGALTLEERMRLAEHQEGIKGPDATDRSYSRGQAYNEALTTAISAAIINGGDVVGAQRAAAEGGIQLDPGDIQDGFDGAMDRWDRAVRSIGSSPPNRHATFGLQQILYKRRSVGEVEAVLRATYPGDPEVDAALTYLERADARLEALGLLADILSPQ